MDIPTCISGQSESSSVSLGGRMTNNKATYAKHCFMDSGRLYGGAEKGDCCCDGHTPFTTPFVCQSAGERCGDH